MSAGGDVTADLRPFGFPLELDGDDRRVVVIGDLNGHDRLLGLLLEGTGLVDGRGAWIGGRTILVQLGDVVNRGDGSRAAMDRLIRLRVEARDVGGEVIWLLGNHEVMTALGHEAYVSADEYMEFATDAELARFHDRRTRYVYELLGEPDLPRRVGPIGGRIRAWEEDNAPGKQAFRAAMAEDGVYGRHLRGLPAAVRVGDAVFAHGGISPRWARLGIEGIAAEVRMEWDRKPVAYQSLDPNGVLRDPLSPVWNRVFCVSGAESVQRDLAAVLEALQVRRMVVGHTRTDSVGGELGRPLARHQGRVIMADVGIGEPGEPGAALVIEDDELRWWSPLRGWGRVCGGGATR